MEIRGFVYLELGLKESVWGFNRGLGDEIVSGYEESARNRENLVEMEV